MEESDFDRIRELVRELGEEGSSDVYSQKGAFFIVDPIDGTANFIKDFHAKFFHFPP